MENDSIIFSDLMSEIAKSLSNLLKLYLLVSAEVEDKAIIDFKPFNLLGYLVIKDSKKNENFHIGANEIMVELKKFGTDSGSEIFSKSKGELLLSDLEYRCIEDWLKFELVVKISRKFFPVKEVDPNMCKSKTLNLKCKIFVHNFFNIKQVPIFGNI